MKKPSFRILLLVSVFLFVGCSGSYSSVRKDFSTKYAVGAEIVDNFIEVGSYKVPLPKGDWTVVWSNAKNFELTGVRFGAGTERASEAAMILMSSDDEPSYVYFNALIELEHNVYINDDRSCLRMKGALEKVVDKDSLFDKQCAEMITAPFYALFGMGTEERTMVIRRSKEHGINNMHYIGTVFLQKANKILRVVYAFPSAAHTPATAWAIVENQKSVAADYF